MTSLYKIAEQICDRLSRQGDIQAIISAVVDCYSTQARLAFYENKNDGISEIDGVFIYVFSGIKPELDCDTDEYYIVMPSSSLRLPHEMGIVSASFMKDKSSFIRVNGLWVDTLKASLLGGRQTYKIEGIRMIFPKMTSNSVGNILLKLAVALDNVDVDEELNIPRAMIDVIVDMVVQKYSPQLPEETKALI